MICLAISGVGGRLGSTILNLAFQDYDFEVVAMVEKKGHPLVGKQERNRRVVTDDPFELQKGDILIEFTTPESTVEHLRYATKAMIIGTTGLDDKQKA